MAGAQSAFDAITGFDTPEHQESVSAGHVAQAPTIKGYGQGNLALALIGGVLGAAAGGVAWIALCTVTGWQLSLFAIVLGGLVGFGVGQGNGGRGGMGAGMIAGLFALAGIVGTQAALTMLALEDAKKESSHITDAEAMDHMAWGVYEELESKGVAMTPNEDGWPTEVLAETSARWKELSAAQKRAYRASMQGDQDTVAHEASVMSYAAAYLWSSGWFGLVCAGLSVSTAWKIASRDVMVEATSRGMIPRVAPQTVAAPSQGSGFRGLPPAAESAKAGGPSTRMGVASEDQTSSREAMAKLGKHAKPGNKADESPRSEAA